MRRFCLLWIVLAVAACGAESARDSLSSAQQALAASRYADALAGAEAGLGRSPDDVTAWNLELVKLEALARDGRGDATVAQLEALAAAKPERMPATQYAATADQLRSAGQGADAIRALDLGLQRFPDDAALLGQIEAAKAAPAGSEELERLRSLGYVE